jgi:hypothetical protein
MHIPAKFAVKWFIDLKYFCPLNPAQVIKHKITDTDEACRSSEKKI